MFCGWCGQSNDDNAELCVQCGLSLHSGVLPMPESEPPAATLPRTHLPVFVEPMPESEPQTPTQQRSDLPVAESVLEVGVGSQIAAPTTTEGPPSRSKVWLASALATALVAVIGLAAWFVLGRGPADPRPKDAIPSAARPVSPVASPASPAATAAAASPCQVHPPSQVVAGTGQPLGPPAGTSGSSDAAGRTVTVGLIGPLTGDRSGLGQQVVQGAQAAIADANTNDIVPGVRFTLDAHDDQGNPSVGGQAASEVSATKAVGIIGPMNSDVAEQVLPLVGDLAVISPGSTAPGMTHGNDAAAPKRPWPGFFRVTTPDQVQGPILAQFVCAGMGISRVATLSETDWYGTTVVNTFAERFVALGGQVSTTLTLPKVTTDYSDAVARIKDSRAQAVVFGGLSPQGKQLRSALTAAGFTGPMVGGDEIFSGPFVEAARDGDVTITPAVSGRLLAGGRPPRLEGATAVQAYDATAALILAIRSAGPDASRAAVRDALQAVSFAGLTGPVSFDTFGDRAVVDATVHTFRGGTWDVSGFVREPSTT